MLRCKKCHHEKTYHSEPIGGTKNCCSNCSRNSEFCTGFEPDNAVEVDTAYLNALIAERDMLKGIIDSISMATFVMGDQTHVPCIVYKYGAVFAEGTKFKTLIEGYTETERQMRRSRTKTGLKK